MSEYDEYSIVYFTLTFQGKYCGYTNCLKLGLDLTDWESESDLILLISCQHIWYKKLDSVFTLFFSYSIDTVYLENLYKTFISCVAQVRSVATPTEFTTVKSSSVGVHLTLLNFTECPLLLKHPSTCSLLPPAQRCAYVCVGIQGAGLKAFTGLDVINLDRLFVQIPPGALPFSSSSLVSFSRNAPRGHQRAQAHYTSLHALTDMCIV